MALPATVQAAGGHTQIRSRHKKNYLEEFVSVVFDVCFHLENRLLGNGDSAFYSA